MSNVSNVSAQEALRRLQEGNQRFVNDRLQRPRDDSHRRTELAKSQHPFAILLSCADSRVVPELAFDQGIGDLFVVRVAGNIANPSSIASIEYAVAHLGVNLVIVLGHESCGAVKAAVAGGDNGYNLNHLVSFIAPAIAAADNSDIGAVVKKNAELNVRQLVTQSVILRDASEKGSLKVVPAYYHLGSGKVDVLG